MVVVERFFFAEPRVLLEFDENIPAAKGVEREPPIGRSISIQTKCGLHPTRMLRSSRPIDLHRGADVILKGNFHDQNLHFRRTELPSRHRAKSVIDKLELERNRRARHSCDMHNPWRQPIRSTSRSSRQEAAFFISDVTQVRPDANPEWDPDSQKIIDDQQAERIQPDYVLAKMKRRRINLGSLE